MLLLESPGRGLRFIYVDALLLLSLWISVFVELEGKSVKSSIFVNSMLTAINENSIMAGDKNGSVFSIASMALVRLCDSLLGCLNTTFDSEKSVSNQMHKLAKRSPSEAQLSKQELSFFLT